MASKIEEILIKKTEFLSLLDVDISKNEEIYEEIKKEIESLNQEKVNIKELSHKPEHTALIPLCKRLYMPGTIVHTGEYLAENKGHPNSYYVLKTVDQTLKGLDDRITAQHHLLEKAELSVYQLEERKKLLLGEKDGDLLHDQMLDEEEIESLSMEVATMPKEIRSDKGVAVKVGNFFEIMEFEES